MREWISLFIIILLVLGIDGKYLLLLWKRMREMLPEVKDFITYSVSIIVKKQNEAIDQRKICFGSNHSQYLLVERVG